MEKLIKDGKVAILISYGYGAGWSTWNSDCPEMLFDKEIVEILLADDVDWAKAEEVAERKYPNAYLGGLDQLEVEWIKQGTKFRVNEYDGSEYIVDESHLELEA